MGTKVVKLVCFLNDKFLPCIPPVKITIPEDYPIRPPQCILIDEDYSTPLFCAIQNALAARISKMPKKYSVSQLLDVWEMSVRQACAPESIPSTETGVLLGI